MKRNRFAKIVLLGVVILFSASFVKGQGAQLLNNISFENTKPGNAAPNFCLPPGSGHGGHNGLIVPIQDYFLRVADWDSHYYIELSDYCSSQTYNHSPDWIGGSVSSPICNLGWDQNFSAGMGAYEAIWQSFDEALDENMCYEVRIKAQITWGTNPTILANNLYVLLGTQQFYYKNDQYAYINPSQPDPLLDDHCIFCDQNYTEYIIAPSEQLMYLKGFPTSDLIALGYNPYSTYAYGSWFEFHGKINLSQFTFNFPISNYIQFGLDIRDACSGAYLHLDWVEFFESCPDHYEIFGAMIAGPQDEYVASNYIKAGALNKGPAIVTSNGKTAFKAGNFIELVPGFLADYGSVLEIVPNGCEGSGSCNENGGSTGGGRNLNTNGAETINNDNSSTLVNNSSLRKPNNEESESLCKVFPNPGTSTSTITIFDGLIFSITLLDNKGQTLNTIMNINKNQYQLDISNLASGVYYIIVQTSENETFYRKLVKI